DPAHFIKAGLTAKYLVGFGGGYLSNQGLTYQVYNNDSIQLQNRDISYGYTDNAKAQTGCRLAWCYGDLGICFALYKAALFLKDIKLQADVELMLEHVAQRRNLGANSVADAELCHGAMGISHMFKKIYLLTNKPIFNETATHWLMVSLAMASHEDGLAGFKTFKGHTQTWEKNYGFLEGIAGIGLGLISAISDDNDHWDALLLLD
ncbi:MAG: hypothetical protein EOO42_18955, partial [Flavobacteriales bacterium]